MSAGAVTLGKIFFRAHFLKSAYGALEFKAAVAGRIEGVRLGVGGGEQLRHRRAPQPLRRGVEREPGDMTTSRTPSAASWPAKAAMGP